MLLTWGSSQGLNSLLNSAEFIAGFADKGSGEVDLVLSRGTGSATFTRATTATTVNSAGTIVSVASGTPRSYYDPVTLQYLGYLSEGARTNVCIQSANFSDAAWTTTTVSGTGTVSKTPDFAVAPDGTSTACRVQATKGTGFGLLRQTVSGLANPHDSAISIWAKSNTGLTQTVNFSDSNKAFATATVTTSWTRLTSAVTNIAATSSVIDIGAAGSSDNSVDILVWGGQMEIGAGFASTYIPTTTASVTRNADALTYPSSGNVSGTVGTFYCEATLNALFNYNTLIAGSTGNRYLASIDSSGAMFSYDGTTAPSQAFGVVANSSKKFGISWGSGRNYAYNGSTSAKAFDGDFDIGPALNVGFEASGVNIMFGTIRNVRIYQTQLSASQLQAVTG